MNVWVEAPVNETEARKNERLVLHGMRCGKYSLAALSYHIGCDHNNAATRDALERLEKQGKIRRTRLGWAVA